MTGLFKMAGGNGTPGAFLNKIGSIDQKTANEIDGNTPPSSGRSRIRRPMMTPVTPTQVAEPAAAAAAAAGGLQRRSASEILGEDDLMGG